MKKSFGPSKTNRPVSRPSISRSTGTGGFGGGKKVSFQPSKKESFGSHEPFGGTPGGYKKGPDFLPGQRRPRSSWLTPLIVLAVLFVCCLLVVCIGGVYYLFTQGLISIPSFG
jgi:hypothetical protein